MNFKRTAVSIALLTLATQGFAQTATTDARSLDTVTVTGIRASVQRTIDTKRDATMNIDAVSAEDVGKMPDKNLADSLQRLTGVATRTDYDEAEKISLRGVNPNLAIVLYNGHTVSGGDWYLTDQSSASRSASMNLVPSSILSQAQIYKSSQANVVDGGLSGTVNVLLRKGLDQKERFSGAIKLGAAYAELPNKVSPDLSASFGMKNEENTFGVIASLFAEKRFMRRDAYTAGAGYDFLDTSAMNGLTAAQKTELNGVRYASGFGVELAEGVRDRKGGTLSAEAKVNSDLTIGMTAFYSKMGATNYGRAESQSDLVGMMGGQLKSTTGATVYPTISNYTIIPATTVYGVPYKLLTAATIQYPVGVLAPVGSGGGNLRDGAYASSGFLDFDAKYQVNKDLTVKALFSTTRGEGVTDDQPGYTYTVNGNGFAFASNGLSTPSFGYLGVANQGQLAVPGAGGTYTANPSYSGFSTSHDRQVTVDREHSLALDAEYMQSSNIFTSVQFGARFADHKRTYNRQILGAIAATSLSTNPESWNGWPSDFGAGLGTPAGGYKNAYWYYTPEAMQMFAAGASGVTQRFLSSEIDVRERQTALYAMQNFENGALSGNFGVRWVRTEVDPRAAVPIGTAICPASPVPCLAVPAAEYDEFAKRFYNFEMESRAQNNLLPSVNVRFAARKDTILRFGMNQTISRQNWAILGNTYGSPNNGTTAVPKNPPTITGPNPDLKPLIGTNVDLSISWFGAPRQVATVNMFRSTIDGYVKNGVGQTTAVLYNETKKADDTYIVSTAGGIGAIIKGIELSYEQALGKNFGFNANYSYTESVSDDGRPMTGAAKNVGNVGGYFENDSFGARLVYNYTGPYTQFYASEGGVNNTGGTSGNLASVNNTLTSAPYIAAAVGSLDFSASYQIDKHTSLSFSAKNLTNQQRYQSRFAPEEFSRVNASGRQYYLSVNYKL